MHISQSTLDCLKGEFDVEPGDGGSRCEYLDEKGIETYLIIASKPEVKKTAAQHGLSGPVSPPPAPDRPREGGSRSRAGRRVDRAVGGTPVGAGGGEAGSGGRSARGSGRLTLRWPEGKPPEMSVAPGWWLVGA